MRILRQVSLGLVAIMLIAGTYLGRARSTSWQEPLWVTVYPITADSTPATMDYVARLERDDFLPIGRFLEAEAKRYGVAVDPPFRMDIGVPVESLPPAPPESGNPLSVAAWSLQLRWWAWRALADQPDPEPDIRMFVIYHDPDRLTALPHSLGLREGMLGVSHVFASGQMRGSNQVVIAHELLHTLGATDKYDPATNLPRFPEGFAEPERSPRFPQQFAEIMGGRIPITAETAEIPSGLDLLRVGEKTAEEIRWSDPDR